MEGGPGGGFVVHLGMLAAIETTGDTCGVALFDGNRLVCELHAEITRSHDRLLAHLYKELLLVAGVAPTDVSRIAVSVGPGSFTGIRIGISFASGLALATGAVLIPVPTLEAIAYSLRHVAHICKRSRVLSLVPAGRDKLYASLYQITPEFVPLTMARAIAVKHIPTLLDENVLAAGPGALLLDPSCNDSIAEGAESLTASAVGRMGLYLHYNGAGKAPEEVTPLYIGAFVPVTQAKKGAMAPSSTSAFTTTDD